MSSFYALEEITKILGVNPQSVEYCIKMEWLSPHGAVENSPFDTEDLARLKLIFEIRERLGVNDQGVPIILHLIDQLHLAYHHLKGLENLDEIHDQR